MKPFEQVIRLHRPAQLCAKSEKPRRLYLVFNVSRGRPSAPPATAAVPSWMQFVDPGLTFTQSYPNVLVLDILPNEDTNKAQMIELAITAADEWVDLIRCVYEIDSAKCLVVDIEKGESGDTEAEAVVKKEPALDQLVNAEREYAELWAQLPTLKAEDMPRFRQFFADLDRHTERALRAAYQRSSTSTELPPDNDLDATRKTLEWHVAQRLRSPSSGALLDANDDLYKERQENARSVARLYLRLVKKYFETDGAIDFAAYDRAFELFANGDLRLRLAKYGAMTTQPSSGYFFFFAELAIYCAGCGQKDATWINKEWLDAADTWRRLAAPMIWSQPVFRHVYGRKDGKKDNPFTDYAEAHFRRSLDESKREGHLAPLRGKSFDQLLATSIAQMQTGPPAPEASSPGAPEPGVPDLASLSSDSLPSVTLTPVAPAPVAPGPLSV